MTEDNASLTLVRYDGLWAPRWVHHFLIKPLTALLAWSITWWLLTLLGALYPEVVGAAFGCFAFPLIFKKWEPVWMWPPTVITKKPKWRGDTTVDVTCAMLPIPVVVGFQQGWETLVLVVVTFVLGLLYTVNYQEASP